MGMKIELFYNPGCPVCPHAKKVVKKVLKKYPQIEYEEINSFEHQDRVITLGLQTVPAIVIDGTLWQTGIPNKNALRKEIERNIS